MTRLLNLMFGRRVARETSQYLARLSTASQDATRRQSNRLLAGFRQTAEAKVRFGATEWKAPVDVPLPEIVRAHGLITGGTGSGKSMLGLLILKQLIEQPASDTGFGVLDAKGELFWGALWLLRKRLEDLSGRDPQAAKALRRRIMICDFSSRDPLSAYNLLARPASADPEFFALSRADLVMDLLQGDKLSMGGVALLQRLFMLLSEFNLPITWAGQVIRDPGLRHRLLAESKDRSLARYFAQQFESAPKPTLAAIERRIEALAASESVRLVLNGTTAPDFRELQDDGRIILINCFGENIARSVRYLLQGLVLSDIRQAVFARRRKDLPFLWFCDEAQNFFTSERLREHMHDLLTMSRSFGSFFLYLTQNMTTAVGDARLLRVLYTNIRWAFAMRGDPADCEFLAPALPVTGRKLKPCDSPFEEREFYSEREERRLLLEAISQLPDRTGYLWLKPHAAGALNLRTADLVMPHGSDLERDTQSIRRDTTVGGRLTRKAYERHMADRDQRWQEPEGDVSELLTAAYRKSRGSRAQ